MKHLILMLITLQLSSPQAFAKETHDFYGKEGDPKRFFEPKEMKLKLSDGTKLMLKLEAPKGHTTSYNDLLVVAECPAEKKPAVKEKLEACGFTHFEYENKKLTLHLTEYNPDSTEGLCTGTAYTREVELCPTKTTNK